ncbi:hypothetical protein [Thermosipho globiformans]|uniref:hypothetical protein n=1 Tax=Thermosipho globiformans TaxID=380685 RepID=UPI000F8F3FC1|nr:hypothetical protein [Thermosipho globiformans]
MWVQGITIKNKHKVLNYLRELTRINFEEVTIIVKGGSGDYEEYQRILNRTIGQKGGHHNRKFRHRNKTSA